MLHAAVRSRSNVLDLVMRHSSAGLDVTTVSVEWYSTNCLNCAVRPGSSPRTRSSSENEPSPRTLAENKFLDNLGQPGESSNRFVNSLRKNGRRHLF